jgi:hypothetical protein
LALPGEDAKEDGAKEDQNNQEARRPPDILRDGELVVPAYVKTFQQTRSSSQPQHIKVLF